MHWLIGLLLIAHGLVHLAIWLSPPSSDAPVEVRRSPFFGDLGRRATVLGVIAGGAFAIAGLAYLLQLAWWPPALIGAAAVSTTLLVLTFTPWWLMALAINALIVVLVWRDLLPA